MHFCHVCKNKWVLGFRNRCLHFSLHVSSLVIHQLPLASTCKMTDFTCPSSLVMWLLLSPFQLCLSYCVTSLNQLPPATNQYGSNIEKPKDEKGGKYAQDNSVSAKHLLSSLLHRSKAFHAILDGDARRTATHITYLRCGASRITTGRENGLFALKIVEHLFEQRNINQSTIKTWGNPPTLTRFGFDFISGRGEKRNQNEGREGKSGTGRNARSVTWCHHVAFRGSSFPQVIFDP